MQNNALVLNKFKNIPQLKQQLQALALVDAIFSPEWEYRYFSFNSQWDSANKESMASFRDGQGNEYFILFSEHQVIAKVFASEIRSNIDFNQIPDHFESFKNEVAFNLENHSYIFWSTENPLSFKIIPEQLNKYPLLDFVVQNVEDYWLWAQDYYEVDINLEILKQVFNNLKITDDQLAILNPELTVEDLNDDISEIFGE